MSYHYPTRKITDLRVTYQNGNKEDFGSTTYPGSTSCVIQCKLKELPTEFKMSYYNSVTCYHVECCPLIDDPNQCNEKNIPFSLDGCCDQEKIEEEIEESKKIIYENDQKGIKYRIIEGVTRKPTRECWCKFIYDIVNTGEGIIKFGPNDKSHGNYPYYILIHGYKIIGSSSSSSSDMEIKGKISFETHTAGTVRKERRSDFIYYDIASSEYIKIRHWEKYSISSVDINITISRFPYEFLIEMEDITLRTTSLTNCQSIGNLSAKVDCTLKNCWCTAYNSLRSTGSFNITIPMRIVSSSNDYHAKSEYSTTIEGKINSLDKDKMDLTFKFTSKWINNYNSYHDF